MGEQDAGVDFCRWLKLYFERVVAFVNELANVQESVMSRLRKGFVEF